MILYPALSEGDADKDVGSEGVWLLTLNKQHPVKRGCSLLVPERCEWWQMHSQGRAVTWNVAAKGGPRSDTHALNSSLLSKYYVLCSVLGIIQQGTKQTNMWCLRYSRGWGGDGK